MKRNRWDPSRSADRLAYTEAVFDPSMIRGQQHLTRDASVLALIPHFKCERWLRDSLATMVAQTRPLQGIAVIDDGSGDPPVEIVREFPEVTLLAAEENAGPYRLIQAAIDHTGYDAYLFQDADDWSSPWRLELLLAEAERTGAELVGCQGFRVLIDEGEVLPYTYPLDVNAALANRPSGYYVCHGASLIARDLVMRLGGFATGLRFSADTEFQRRAAFVARVVNVPQFCYYRRDRTDSLTGAPETGLRSAARSELGALLRERAMLNAERVAAGQEPDLTPFAVADPIALLHVAGPRLRSVDGGTWPE